MVARSAPISKIKGNTQRPIGISAFGSELRINDGSAVVEMGTTIMPANMAPIHQLIKEFRLRLKALLSVQSCCQSHGEPGFVAWIAASCLSFLYPYTAPAINPKPINAKTRPNAAPAMGFSFLWIAGEEERNANVKAVPKPKNGSPKRNKNTTAALDGRPRNKNTSPGLGGCPIGRF